MYLSYNILKEFCDLKILPEKLADILTSHSFEVESLKSVGKNFNKIVVGEILKVKKHPSADRLKVCVVNVGKQKKKEVQIVCGARNVEAGQKVPVALTGAVFSNGMEIKNAKIRGVDSNGMICAESELFLGENSNGIMVLDSKLKIGDNLAEALKLKDYLIEVDNKSITNRPDLWGHLGVAREISAILSLRFKFSKQSLPAVVKNKKLNIKINDYKLCNRYLGVVIDNLNIGPSPLWMKNRLQNLGIRPINNIVDITNYVMLEIGQPMHAFDKNKIAGDGQKTIIVRKAKDKEKILVLDDKEYILSKNDLVIADKKNPIAIAGIMGDKNFSVNNGTKSIILESANFNPLAVRKTSSRLRLRSESSIRFEKGLDPNLAEIAFNRAVQLISQIIPNVKISNVFDNKNFKLNQKPIKVSIKDVNKKIGVQSKNKKITAVLEKLGFKVKINKNDVIDVKVPSWRATGDIKIPEDIIEEIVRIYGYDKIIPVLPKTELKPFIILPEKKIVDLAKDILSRNLGMVEVYNYSFNNKDQLEQLGISASWLVENCVKLLNPSSEKQNLMRNSLLLNLLNNARQNTRNFDCFSLFEIGSVYIKEKGEYKQDFLKQTFLPKQCKMASGIIVGNKSSKKEDVFLKTKNIVRVLLNELGFDKVEFFVIDFKTIPVFFHPARSMEIKVNNKKIGIFGEVHPKILSKMEFDKKGIGIFELDLSLLSRIKIIEKKYKELPKFPAIQRDLAFILDKKILYNEIIKEIKNASDLIVGIDLFDIYENEKILGADKKSLAFHIIIQSRDRTLKNEEADKIQKDIIGNLSKKFKAKIRR
ncbi:MAG: phenylalanine--tRNA ligase subunit beta [Patescibacteria group bacterium]|nr:phenylalanine--tRNA ligase subunit beta [Patescibacteria group bacterium]